MSNTSASPIHDSLGRDISHPSDFVSKVEPVLPPSTKITEVSTVQKFLTGSGMTREDSDGIINTVALINALVLTIPYSFAASLDYAYWEWLEDAYNSKECEDVVKISCPKSPKDCWESTYIMVQGNLACTVYASITALCICGFYYLMRPPCVDEDGKSAKVKPTIIQKIYTNTGDVDGLEFHDRKSNQTSHFKDEGDEQLSLKGDAIFQLWWVKAKYVILIIVAATFISVVTSLCLFNNVSGSYVTSSKHLCVQSPRNAISMFVGVGTFVLAVIVSLYLMYL